MGPIALRIFLLERHGETGETLSAFLCSRGHKVVCVSSDSALLKLLSRSACDVLIIDLGHDGRAIEFWQKAGLPPSVRAIAISGDCGEDYSEAARAAGFHFCLQKPFRPDALLWLLASAGQNAMKAE
jgi:DNA-binding response OmpR family regulator